MSAITLSSISSAASKYIFDNEEEEDDWSAPPPSQVSGQGLRRTKRVIEQLKCNEKEGLERIAALAASESAKMPDLPIDKSKCNRGVGMAS